MHKKQVVEKLKKGVSQLLKGNGVELIKGQARFISPRELDIDGRKVTATHIIIATGSTWMSLPNLQPDGKSIITSDEALELTELPKSAVIVGGGYIGCEFASMLNSMGTEVAVVEATEGLLPMVEKRIRDLLSREYKKRGIKIYTGTKVERADIANNGVQCRLSNGETLTGDKMLLSVGRKVNVDGLDLGNAGVQTGAKGEIKVNQRFETEVKGIYAIGDVTGGIMLAHAASEQAITCVENMCGHRSKYDDAYVPACIFSEPEVAYAGQTTEQLGGVEFKTGRFPFAALGKALVDGTPEGEIIVHADGDGRLLGVHAIGAGAVGIIAEATLALKNGLTIDDIAETIHAHPTMSEAFLEAVCDVEGRAIHKISSNK